MSQPNSPFGKFASFPIPNGESNTFLLTTAFEIFPCLRTTIFLLALLFSIINKPIFFSSVSLVTLVSPPHYNRLTFSACVVPKRDHREWVRHDTCYYSIVLTLEWSWMRIISLFTHPRARSVVFATMWYYSFTSARTLRYCWNLSYRPAALPHISSIVSMHDYSSCPCQAAFLLLPNLPPAP